MHRTFSYARTLTGLIAAGAVAAAFTGCSGDGFDPPVGNPTVTMTAEPPPPISGGTLLVTADGRTAVAGDPDRHGIWVVDLSGSDIAFLPVGEREEPGRVVEDGQGRAHVALRRGGAVVTVDVAARAIVDRRDVCVAPSGLAYDAAADALHVACMGGELVTLPAAGGAATRKLRLDKDLRDVVVDGDRLLVSRFRSAETLAVSADGVVSARHKLPEFVADGGLGSSYTPSVAWRMTALPGGGAAMVHQRAMSTPVLIQTNAYYSMAGCDGNIVHAAISVLQDLVDSVELPPAAAAIPMVGLPVDIAVSRAGDRVAIVGAGNDKVVTTTPSNIESDSGLGSCFPNAQEQQVPGQPVAVAFDAEGSVVVQLREPAGIVVLGKRNIALPGDSVRDTGHDMFHRPPSEFAAMSCASCHPQGHEDGHTWDFDPIGLRRTQAIGGGILQTAPLHWDGDMSDFHDLMGEVFVSRMSGPNPGARQLRLMERFIENIPAFPASPPEDPEAVARGASIFASAQVGCADCHSGTMLTNNRNEDVGRAEILQVPTLIGISGRAPFMHDGCAETLRDRFDPACAGDKHGDVSALSEAEISDLIAYLESL